MAKCLNEGCSNEVVTKEGKRARKTCSDSCRQQVWQRNKQGNKFIKVPRAEWEKLKGVVPERQNQLINAARGRDESGINEDEIQKKISIIEKETIPPERNTSLGRKVWENEQRNRILKLKNNKQWES